MDNFLDYLKIALPGLEEEKYAKVLSYLQYKGVSSLANLHKIAEKDLADILGDEAARALMACIRDVAAKGPKNDGAASTAGPGTASQEGGSVGPAKESPSLGKAALPLVVSQNCDHVNSGAVACTPAAGAQSVAVVESGVTMKDMLQMVLAVQQTEAQRTRELMQYEGDKTEKMINAMVTMQTQNLQAMQTQMTETAGCFNATLNTMTEQMSQQAEWNRDTVKVMTEQMENSNRIHADTLRQMQSAMQGQDKRHADTLSMMNNSMAKTAEEHEETMRRMQEVLASKNDPACVIC